MIFFSFILKNKRIVAQNTMTCRDGSMVFSHLRKSSFPLRIIFDQLLREWSLRAEKNARNILRLAILSIPHWRMLVTSINFPRQSLRTRCANRVFLHHSVFVSWMFVRIFGYAPGPTCSRSGHLEGYSRFETRVTSITMGDGPFLHQHLTSVSFFCSYIHIYICFVDVRLFCQINIISYN